MPTKAKKQPTPATPVIPSKWDIIPIHVSDRGTFKECRRRWAWSSPARRNLVPRIAAYGVIKPLWYGTGIHNALQAYYGPLKQDPVSVFEAWFKLQYEGGLVHVDELPEFIDRNPKPGSKKNTYWVDGIRDLLPNDEDEEFQELYHMGIGMLSYYKQYAERHDDFEILDLEHLFSVPILDPDGYPLYWTDKREMPEGWNPDLSLENDYGPLIKIAPAEPPYPAGAWQKQVHARGKIDVIGRRLDNGAYIIRDYKTTARLDEDYFRHLDLDEQVTSYLTLAEREAEMYGLPYTQIDYIDYVGLRKAYPKPPTMTQKGLPSIDRQKESTTPEMFEACIKEHNLEVIFKANEKMQQYYTYLLEAGEKQFIWVEKVRRNKQFKQNAALRLYYEAVDMLNDPILYPNPSKNYTCLNCRFRAPCIAAEDGSDWQAILDGNYIQNYDR
jgi:hypothetical protein